MNARIIAVAPQVPGYVVKLLIHDHTPVQEGDLLLQVDPRTCQAEVDQARANLDFAEAQAKCTRRIRAIQLTIGRNKNQEPLA